MGWHGMGMGMDYGEVSKSKRAHVSFRRVAELFAPYKLHVIGVFFCIVATAAMGVVPAYLTGLIIDKAIGGHNGSLLITLTILTITVVLVSGLIGVLQSFLNNLIGQHVMADMREQLYRHMLDLSLRYFGQTKLGDLISRFNNDIGGIQNVVTSTFVNIVSSIITIIITLGFMLVYNLPLTIVAIIIIPAFAIPTRQVGRIRRRLSRETQEKLAEISTSLEETLDISGIMLIKNYVRQDHESQHFNHISQDLTRLQIRQNMIGRWFFMFIGLFSTLGPALIFLIGGYEIIGIIPGHITIGEIVAFITLIGRLYPPATSLLNVYVDIQGAASLFDRIFEIMDEPRDIRDIPNAQAIPQVRGKITFDHVSFAYVPDRLALNDLSFTIQPGQLVALVGPSGAGKSTIISLIPRLYDVSGGAIRIDEFDIRNVKLYSLGEQIGMVTQETYLFHDSLYANIAYGNLNATKDKVIAAAKAANIHEFITSLPKGYDTVVGERGYKLSGGEKQRIAIARVILKDPRILVLDEATSSLDSQSEALIQQALVPLMKGRTTVVIAHRLSTILAADLILVIEGGHIAERGTHLDLLEKGGLYATLYREQFRAETERLMGITTLKA